MVPSSYFLTKITSTKSRGAMIPIAAEGVTVLQIDTSCTRVGKQGNVLKDRMKQRWQQLVKCPPIADARRPADTRWI